MTTDTILWAGPLALIALAMGAEWLASRAVRAVAERDDFDGGYRHLNEPLRQTRIRSTHIITTRGSHDE